ncbi:MAG: hypothetical protein AMK72_15435 [Planctomycetes bacterium SM23_25]|nr:MAG: hypothetical protein AMK72_15435 [Planctomycetes bacterium SM23_25]
MPYSSDGRRIVSGSWDNTVRVWDAETHRCLEVIQDWGAVTAIAAGCSSAPPWRAIGPDQGIVIEPTGGGEAAARFPIALRNVITHPKGRAWPGSFGTRLHIITLEGDPKSAQRNDGNEDQPD